MTLAFCPDLWRLRQWLPDQMGRWAQYRRRGTSKPLDAEPGILSITLDPGGFGLTSGILTITFDRPVETCDASDLTCAVQDEGEFTFANPPSSFTPGETVAEWTSTDFAAATPPVTLLVWFGTDGPIVFEDESELNEIETSDVTVL